VADERSGKLERAEIRVLNGKNEGDVIECAFNPPEYDVEKRVNYGQLKATGSGASVQQFVDGSAETLSMELFFDTSIERTDVREEYIDDFDQLLEVDGELHAPPICKFVWGSGLEFTALVESARKRFTKFLPSGEPVRARVNVTFREYETSDFHRSKVSPESTDKTKAWTVTEGDTLWLIAAEEYGDPAHWRTIAETNDVEDPRQLEAGRVLELPPL